MYICIYIYIYIHTYSVGVLLLIGRCSWIVMEFKLFGGCGASPSCAELRGGLRVRKGEANPSCAELRRACADPHVFSLI